MQARSPSFFFFFSCSYLSLKFLLSHPKTAFQLFFKFYFLIHLSSWSRWLLSLDSKLFRNKNKYLCCRDHCSAMLCRSVSCTSSIFCEPASWRGDLDLMLNTIFWICFEHTSVHTSASELGSIFDCKMHLNKQSDSLMWSSCLFPPHSASHSGYS